MQLGLHALGIGVGARRTAIDAVAVAAEAEGFSTLWSGEHVVMVDRPESAMRVLWREDVASFDGEFVAFESVRVNPKPVRRRQIPIVVGGNSDAALRRAAAWGDGWYGFTLAGVDVVRERIAVLNELCREHGRDVRELHLAVALDGGEPGEIASVADLGVNQLVLVEVPPEDPRATADWVGALARRWRAARS